MANSALEYLMCERAPGAACGKNASDNHITDCQEDAEDKHSKRQPSQHTADTPAKFVNQTLDLELSEKQHQRIDSERWKMGGGGVGCI